MEEKEVKEFFRAIYVERGYKDLNEIKLSWSVVFGKYTLSQIVEGLNWISDHVTYRPNSAHFKLALSTQDKFLVQKAMDSIEDALSKHGYTHPLKAKELLGDRLWQAIGYSGGYQKLCREFGRANTQYIAQLRDRILANLDSPLKFQEALPESKKMNNLITTTIKKLGDKNE